MYELQVEVSQMKKKLLNKDEEIELLNFYKKLYERDEQTANESKKRKRESCSSTTSFSSALRGDELRDRFSFGP